MKPARPMNKSVKSQSQRFGTTTGVFIAIILSSQHEWEPAWESQTTYATVVTITHRAEYATKLCNGWARFPM